MLHAAVLRSPHAHARIVRIDTSRARALPGVFAVITGEDAAELTNPLPAFCAEPVVQYALAVEQGPLRGEAVAAVAAVDRYTAEDAVALIDVEYEPAAGAHRPDGGDEAGRAQGARQPAEQPRLREDACLRRRDRRLRLRRTA